MLKIKNRNIRAFTLAEILVSLLIIIILSTLFLANYEVGRKSSDLINFQLTLLNDLEGVKQRALSLESYNNQVPRYWGLHLNKASSTYDIFVALGDSDQIVKIQKFPANSFISNINLGDEVLILFSTSDGFPVFYNMSNQSFSSNDLIIELRSSDFNYGKTLIINSHGLIDHGRCSCEPNYFNKCSWC